mgnify:FL=1
MRLIILTFLALLAFASNSILNRWALLDGTTGPLTFSFVRVSSGAVLLWIIVASKNINWRHRFQILKSI